MFLWTLGSELAGEKGEKAIQGVGDHCGVACLTEPSQSSLLLANWDIDIGRRGTLQGQTESSELVLPAGSVSGKWRVVINLLDLLGGLVCFVFASGH